MTLSDDSSEGIGRMKGAQTLLRVERGHASDEELAALAAVLIALCGSGEASGEEPAVACSAWWSRPEGYASPGSWR
ncbi:acyl-CoA carboxylase epsilon subunit [Streptomyces sp. NPDC057382]|uniref:acyl-CoA carboxylase epsilon subunit n=1 Tax=unclassified Streptomyces TaxID=2593676 RepID=UPI00363AA202